MGVSAFTGVKRSSLDMDFEIGSWTFGCMGLLPLPPIFGLGCHKTGTNGSYLFWCTPSINSGFPVST